ncbi:MAG: hypothetical protein J5888_02395 [Bacteroidaceae bacterium]|nr:hypothetical protein [Bacteroidaceae bacterium]
MKKRVSHLEQPQRRFSKAKHGEEIMRLYRTMPTAELAERLGLEPRQISDFIYRNNCEGWAGKDSGERTRVASENGRKGGRPRRKS